MAVEKKRVAPVAPPTPHPVRRLVILGFLIVLMLGALGAGTIWSSAKWYPSLALDLEGGTEVVLAPELTEDGKGQKITEDDINQAIEVIRKRIDASGVAEAEITSEAGNNIVVGIPGQPSQETLELVRNSAVLRFRSVLAVLPNSVVSSEEALKQLKVAKVEELSDKPEKTPTNPSDDAWITPKLQYQALTLDCAKTKNTSADDPAKPLVACADEDERAAKYILGPAEVNGTEITRAVAGPRTNSQGTIIGGYQVNLEFSSTGGKQFGDMTTRIYQLPSPHNQSAIVLDGRVVSAPVPNGPITNGGAVISGNFNMESAKTLANQLSFGSLPINFKVHQESQVSATLGSESLKAGLIAGFIGIMLVLLYMFWQYLGIGLVSIGSLALGAILTYFVIAILSWTMGYRLSLPGVVGIIISIGITADSFIVYFERIRDEIREGLSIPRAIDLGWKRAFRTIIVSDMVNFVAAAVLYVLAVGGVRGFAFTLGLTTVIDLLVVVMFTRPMMQLLAKTKFVGAGHKYSGIAYEALGVPRHPSAAQFENKNSGLKGVSSAKSLSSSNRNVNATKTTSGMTIAERKAEQRRQEKIAEAESKTDKLEKTVTDEKTELAKGDEA